MSGLTELLIHPCHCTSHQYELKTGSQHRSTLVVKDWDIKFEKCLVTIDNKFNVVNAGSKCNVSKLERCTAQVLNNGCSMMLKAQSLARLFGRVGSIVG